MSANRTVTFGKLCVDCPLRARCTTAKTGRSMPAGPGRAADTSGRLNPHGHRLRVRPDAVPEPDPGPSAAGDPDRAGGRRGPNELGVDDKAFRAALDDYYAGHYTAAIAGFDKLLQVTPQHAQATQFRTLAAKARDRFGDTPVAPAPAPSSRLPLDLSPLAFWSIVGGGGALALTLSTVLLIVLVRRRGSGQGAASPPPGLPPTPFPPPPSSPPRGRTARGAARGWPPRRTSARPAAYPAAERDVTAEPVGRSPTGPSYWFCR